MVSKDGIKLISILSSEWIKTKRTAIRWLIFLVPVLFSLAGVGYISLRKSVEEIYIFQGFFNAWGTLVVPIISSLLSAFLVQEEELAGNFTGYLSTSIPRKFLYFGKFLTLFLFNMVSTVIALIMFYGGMNIVSPGMVNGWGIFIFAMILELFGTLPLLAIHLWLSFIWGTGTSIGIGIGGLVTAAIAGSTPLGDKVWMFIPWAWPSRLAKLPGAYLEFTAGMNMPPSEISSSAILQQLIIGVPAVSICLIVFYIGGIIWFDKWEGRKHYE